MECNLAKTVVADELEGLAFYPPTPPVEQMYMTSFNERARLISKRRQASVKGEALASWREPLTRSSAACMVCLRTKAGSEKQGYRNDDLNLSEEVECSQQCFISSAAR